MDTPESAPQEPHDESAPQEPHDESVPQDESVPHNVILESEIAKQFIDASQGFEKQFEELAQNVDAAQKTSSIINEQVDSVLNRETDHLTKIAQLQRSNEELLNFLTVLRENGAKNAAQIEDLQEKNAAKITKLQEQNAAQIAELQEKISSLTTEHENLGSFLDLLTYAFSLYQKEVEEQRAKVQRIQENLAAVVEKLKAASSSSRTTS